MRRRIALLFLGSLAGFALMACQREQSVQAGREDNSAISSMQDMKGELVRIDPSNKTIVIRTENGMEQTFNNNDKTTVTVMPAPTKGKQKPAAPNDQVSSLAGKTGSEVTVHWNTQGDEKVATSIDVTQMTGGKKPAG